MKILNLKIRIEKTNLEKTKISEAKLVFYIQDFEQFVLK